VLGRPIGLAHDGLVDSLVVAALRLDRDRQPLCSLRRLDAVAVAPVAPGELPVVVEDELVDARDQVEVALPRDVAGLDDRDGLRHRRLPKLAARAAGVWDAHSQLQTERMAGTGDRRRA